MYPVSRPDSPSAGILDRWTGCTVRATSRIAREDRGLADDQRHRLAQPVPRDEPRQLRQRMRLVRSVIGMKVFEIGERRRRIIGAEAEPAIGFVVSLIARPNPVAPIHVEMREATADRAR